MQRAVRVETSRRGGATRSRRAKIAALSGRPGERRRERPRPAVEAAAARWRDSAKRAEVVARPSELHRPGARGTRDSLPGLRRGA